MPRVKKNVAQAGGFVLALCLVILFGEVRAYAEPTPFWDRPANRERIERFEILVSASGDQNHSVFMGAGLVKASPQRVFDVAQQYERLKERSDRFEVVHFNPLTQLLVVVVRFPWGLQEFVAKVTPLDQQELKQIRFEVKKGWGQGSTGELNIQVQPGNPDQSLVFIKGRSQEGKGFSWVTHLGIEAVMKAVANSLRNFVETSVPPTRTLDHDARKAN